MSNSHLWYGFALVSSSYGLSLGKLSEDNKNNLSKLLRGIESELRFSFIDSHKKNTNYIHFIKEIINIKRDYYINEQEKKQKVIEESREVYDLMLKEKERLLNINKKLKEEINKYSKNA